MKKFVAKFYLLLIVIQIAVGVMAQENEPEIPASVTEQLEDQAESTDADSEDDSFQQLLEYYKRRPLNLNSASATELKEFRLLNDIQIQHCLSYRNLLGPFLSIYELQAIPLWDVITIQRILPYVSISDGKSLFENLGERLFAGDNSLLLRASMVLPKSKGYYQQDSVTSHFLGSRQQVLLRYKYNYKNILQYGFLADKDAGEEFFKGSQKTGFDFYSFHFFARKLGIVKAIAIGDFTVNMGQGLIHWQNLAFNKSSSIASVKRQAEVLRPYSSSGEYNFHRGLGITVTKRKWEYTLFVSRRALNATLKKDSVDGQLLYISSILSSGYHRTTVEMGHRNNLQALSFGSVLKYMSKKWHAGINWVDYRFSHPFKPSDQPYDRFSVNENSWRNVSLDYSYTFKNFHIFGEIACDKNFRLALISGLIASIDRSVDIAMVIRRIDKAYQSMYGNAFTENNMPSNETGIYTGISIKASNLVTIEAFGDFYKFPWLRFPSDAPSYGKEYGLLLTYIPNKQVSLTARFRMDQRETNQDQGLSVHTLVQIPRRTLRYQFVYNLSRSFSISNRVEVIWLGSQTGDKEQGFLMFADLKYKPGSKPYSFSTRLQYFETGSYNSRIYAYENDILYANSSPGFFDKGFRWYLNLRTDVRKMLRQKLDWNLDLWIRYALTHYFQLDKIGSELNEIQGPNRSEVKIQLQFSR